MKTIRYAQKAGEKKRRKQTDEDVQKIAKCLAAKLREQRDRVRVPASLAEARLEASVCCSDEKRVKRARAAEQTVSELKDEILWLQLRVKELSATQIPASDAAARHAATPALDAQQAAGKANGGMSLPFAIRAPAFGKLACLSPPSAGRPKHCRHGALPCAMASLHGADR
eukprot:6211741-Pleurochrysis_carterae.AAC.10